MAPDRERVRSPMGRIALPPVVMNVKMCCAKCEEKAKEECEEVNGVVKVVADGSQNKVIVYGAADPPTLLKKMRRHLDKHAMYWPMDESTRDQVAPPLLPVDPVNGLERSAGGPPSKAGTVLPVDPRDGRPLADSREVRQVERELATDAEIRGRAGGPHGVPREVLSHGREGGGPPRDGVFVPPVGAAVDPRAAAGPREERPVQAVDARDVVRSVETMELLGEHPRSSALDPGAPPREVVFIPVGAEDGTPVGPRRKHPVDFRNGRPLDPPRVDVAGRPIGPPAEFREVRFVHDSRDPSIERIREVRPVDVREPGRVPVDETTDLRPIDPHKMNLRHGDPHIVMRTSEPRDDLRPDDPRFQLRPIDHPRDGRRTLDPRALDREMVDLRDERGAALERSEPPPRGTMRGVVPEGLGPVRTGRDAREVHFAPSHGNHLSPFQGRRDMEPRSPPKADYMSRSPRQHQAPDYGPRSPRDEYHGPRSPRNELHGPRSPREEYGAPNPRDHAWGGYGPSSPRFEGAANYTGPRSPRGAAAGDYDPLRQGAPAMRPALDRELSFNEFAQGASAADQGRTTGGVVPMPYEPVDARGAAAFDFHGGGGGGTATAHPRSPRSGGLPGPAGQDQPAVIRGYGDIDPRQFRQPAASEPRDAPLELHGGNAGLRYDDGRDPLYIHDSAARNRDGGLDRSPRRHLQQPGSQFSDVEADTWRNHHPQESYFSDYRPSQDYPARSSGSAAY